MYGYMLLQNSVGLSVGTKTSPCGETVPDETSPTGGTGHPAAVSADPGARMP